VKKLLLRVHETLVRDIITAPIRVWTVFIVLTLLGLAIAPLY
jgi:hypothetical protein